MMDNIYLMLKQINEKLDLLIGALADDEQDIDRYDFDGNSFGGDRNELSEL